MKKSLTVRRSLRAKFKSSTEVEVVVFDHFSGEEFLYQIEIPSPRSDQLIANEQTSEESDQVTIEKEEVPHDKQSSEDEAATD